MTRETGEEHLLVSPILDCDYTGELAYHLKYTRWSLADDS